MKIVNYETSEQAEIPNGVPIPEGYEKVQDDDEDIDIDNVDDEEDIDDEPPQKEIKLEPIPKTIKSKKRIIKGLAEPIDFKDLPNKLILDITFWAKGGNKGGAKRIVNETFLNERLKDEKMRQSEFKKAIMKAPAFRDFLTAGIKDILKVTGKAYYQDSGEQITNLGILVEITPEDILAYKESHPEEPEEEIPQEKVVEKIIQSPQNNTEFQNKLTETLLNKTLSEKSPTLQSESIAETIRAITPLLKQDNGKSDSMMEMVKFAIDMFQKQAETNQKNIEAFAKSMVEALKPQVQATETKKLTQEEQLAYIREKREIEREIKQKEREDERESKRKEREDARDDALAEFKLNMDIEQLKEKYGVSKKKVDPVMDRLGQIEEAIKTVVGAGKVVKKVIAPEVPLPDEDGFSKTLELVGDIVTNENLWTGLNKAIDGFSKIRSGTLATQQPETPQIPGQVPTQTGELPPETVLNEEGIAQIRQAIQEDPSAFFRKAEVTKIMNTNISLYDFLWDRHPKLMKELVGELRKASLEDEELDTDEQPKTETSSAQTPQTQEEDMKQKPILPEVQEIIAIPEKVKEYLKDQIIIDKIIADENSLKVLISDDKVLQFIKQDKETFELLQGNEALTKKLQSLFTKLVVVNPELSQKLMKLFTEV